MKINTKEESYVFPLGYAIFSKLDKRERKKIEEHFCSLGWRAREKRERGRARLRERKRRRRRKKRRKRVQS